MVVHQNSSFGFAEDVSEVMVFCQYSIQVDWNWGHAHQSARHFGSCNLKAKTLGTLHCAFTLKHFGIDESNSRVVLGFIWSVGLGCSGTRSGFAIMGVFGIWTGSDLVVVFVQNIMQLWTQSIEGLYWVSQQYPSTRVQLESKGVT